MGLDDILGNPYIMGGLNAYLTAITTPRRAGWGTALARGGLGGLQTMMQMPYLQAQTKQAQAKAAQMGAAQEAIKSLPTADQPWAQMAPGAAATAHFKGGGTGAADNAQAAAVYAQLAEQAKGTPQEATFRILSESYAKLGTGKMPAGVASGVLAMPGQNLTQTHQAQQIEAFPAEQQRQEKADTRADTSLGLQEHTAKLQQQAADRADERFRWEQAQAELKAKAGKSGKASEKTAVAMTLDDDYDQLEQLVKDPEVQAMIGPGAGLVAKGKEKIGGTLGGVAPKLTPKQADFMTVLNRVRNKTYNVRTGQAASKEQYGQIREELPEVTQPMEVFVAHMKGSRGEVQNILQAKRALGEKIPEKWRGAETPPTPVKEAPVDDEESRTVTPRGNPNRPIVYPTKEEADKARAAEGQPVSVKGKSVAGPRYRITTGTHAGETHTMDELKALHGAGTLQATDQYEEAR